MTTFSVIIPTFNRARFVTEAVRSVLEQEFKALEIIVLTMDQQIILIALSRPT